MDRCKKQHGCPVQLQRFVRLKLKLWFHSHTCAKLLTNYSKFLDCQWQSLDLSSLDCSRKALPSLLAQIGIKDRCDVANQQPSRRQNLDLARVDTQQAIGF